VFLLLACIDGPILVVDSTPPLVEDERTWAHDRPSTGCLIDEDGDGFDACEDCDDQDPNRFPGAEEWCDGVDQDCDGAVDDHAMDAVEGWLDLDGDGFAGPDGVVFVCPETPGVHWEITDCDDTRTSVFPGALEVCDGLDTDCDGEIEETLVPTDYPTIQEALDEGTWIDWICVEPGVYRESLDMPYYDVVLESVGGSDVTTIQGNREDSVVTIRRGNSLATELRGFTITGGFAKPGSGGSVRYGGGLHVNASAATLEDLHITGNLCRGNERCYGAGLAITDGDVVMTDVRVTGNRSTNCHRAYGGGAWFDHSNVEMLGGGFDANEQDGCEWTRGVGLFAWGGDTRLRNVTFRGNRSSRSPVEGTALGTYSWASMDVENAVFAGNHADTDSSIDGVIYQSTGYLGLRNVSIVGNTGRAGGVECGGIRIDYPDAGVDLRNVDISDNRIDAERYSGGWFCNRYAGRPAIDARFVNVFGNDHDDFGDLSDVIGLTNVSPGYADLSGEDPRAWDLRLGPDSELIDAGAPWIHDPDGSRADIGAYGGPGAADW